jgi:GTP cyclohydrolase II
MGIPQIVPQPSNSARLRPAKPADLPRQVDFFDVERAIGDFRRGAPVALIGATGAVLAQSLEGLNEAGVVRLTGLAETDLRLALTGPRAAALGIGAATSGILVCRLTTAPDPALLRSLADPLAPGAVSAERDRLAAEEMPAGEEAAAAVELAKLAALLPTVLLAPVSRKDAVAIAGAENLLRVDTSAVLSYRRAMAANLVRVSDARVPLHGAEDCRIVAFRPSDGGPEHLAIIVGRPEAGAPVLARLHSSCVTGDLLGSLRCDCGDQLRGAIAEIAKAGSGVLLYLMQEGRGIGIVNKLRAYRLQDAGFDTLDANHQLGFDPDERIYDAAAEMLRQLGFARVRLMTNNPDKLAALAAAGIEIAERVPHVFPSNQHNTVYLQTKATRAGHLF